MATDSEVYVKCENCGGTGRVSNGDDTQGRPCDKCERASGFRPVGLTLATVHRAIDEATRFYGADGSPVPYGAQGSHVVDAMDCVHGMRVTAARELEELRARDGKSKAYQI